ncbi:hypothetical protein GCM10010831_07450 [Psychroflexus salis]|uniref:Uncharacterized protein n=1 Tax=Psychroflexus salis TaxID=1526574 RepID=A0A916ZPV3_9FLAO|nr:hypothetical protein GCM10010831_07450 [Psychroflexus salis]
MIFVVFAKVLSVFTKQNRIIFLALLVFIEFGYLEDLVIVRIPKNTFLSDSFFIKQNPYSK